MKVTDYFLDDARIKGWRFDRWNSTPKTAVFKKNGRNRAIIGANRKVVLCPYIDKLCGKNTKLRRKVVDILSVVRDPVERALALKIAFDQETLDYTDINSDFQSGKKNDDYSRSTGNTLAVGFGSSNSWRSHIDWDITDIPASTINDVDLIVVVDFAYGAGDTVKITGFGTTQINITNYPDDDTGNENLYNDIDSKTTLVSGLTDFQSTGSKTIDLGSTADSQLQANLASDFWSIGFKGSDEATNAATWTSSRGGASEDRPQLIVTYTTGGGGFAHSQAILM